MGFTFNNVHSKDMGIGYSIQSIPYLPPKRQTEVTIQGRDGAYIFEDGFNNIKIDLSCAIIGYEITERRKRAREIASWLCSTGILVFDHEPDIEYKVIQVINDINSTILAREYRDTFNITFVCEPYQQQTYYGDSFTWETMDSTWDSTNLPWVGYERIFTINEPRTIKITNTGTYKALPIIILNGTATNIKIHTMEYNNLSGKIYIDCKNMVVYSIGEGNIKINKMQNFSGTFLEILPGENLFSVSGTNLNLTLEFDYRSTYL